MTRTASALNGKKTDQHFKQRHSIFQSDSYLNTRVTAQIKIKLLRMSDATVYSSTGRNVTAFALL